MKKWIKEFGAIGAALTIGFSTGMIWWQVIILWVFLDLMTVSDKQISKYLGGDQ